MRAHTITALLATGMLTFAVTADAHGPHESQSAGTGTVTAHRVVVADAASPAVRVIDLDSGATLATYTLSAPAQLHAGASGRYVYAAQGEPGRIAVIDTGLAFEDHGDHADLQVSAPRLLRHRLDGPRPSHVNHGAGRVAAFFDGAGLARVISEEDLVAGRVDRAKRLETGIEHHGVAKPIGRFVAISVPTAGARLPDAIELRDDNGRGSERIACPRMHGEATTARFTVFACADGVVVYDAGRDGVTGRHVGYPRSLPPERMIRSMVGARSYAFVAGDFGPSGMVVLDPAHAEGEFRFIELPARRVAYTLHPASGDRLFVMLEDGRLAAFNPLNGDTSGSIALTGRYSLDAPGPRPRLSTAGPYVIVESGRRRARRRRRRVTRGPAADRGSRRTDRHPRRRRHRRGALNESMLRRLAPCRHLRAEQERRSLRSSGDGTMSAKTTCLGPCNLAPVLQVWPEGVYYGGVDEAGLDRIIERHLIGGAVVEDLAYAPTGKKQFLRGSES